MKLGGWGVFLLSRISDLYYQPLSFNGVDAGPAALWGDGALKNVILLGIGEPFFYHLEVALNGKVPV
jgi:hypothetical protein